MLTALFIVISLLLVLACGVFVAAEIGMITSDRAAVERAAAEGDAKAGKVLTMLKHL
jgi:CBS domain containing-hemolysin-like protein